MTARAPQLDTHPYPQETAVPAAQELVPCEVCGEPVPRVPFRYATDLKYGVCPIGQAAACVERAMERGREAARAAAERAASVAAAVVEGAARAREETASAAAEADGEAPAETGEPGPVAAKTAPRTRASRARKAALDEAQRKPEPAA